MPSAVEPMVVSDPLQIPGHTMHGDWALPGIPYSYLNVKLMWRTIHRDRKPVFVTFDSICVKPGDYYGFDSTAEDSERYQKADPKHPGILVKGMPNPKNLPYRMVDGRHRLVKMKRQGVTVGRFYVFTYEEADPFIRRVTYDPNAVVELPENWNGPR